MLADSAPSADAWPPRPRLARAFYKGHGLGNDYLVIEEGPDWEASPGAVARVCARHEGVGADGIVVLLSDRGGDVYRARMFNPDGSEFERSGNGLRVLASFLARHADAGPYEVEVGGDRVCLRVHSSVGGAHDVSVEMGRARTGAAAVGLAAGVLSAGGVIDGPHGEELTVVPVSVGNPHLVVLTEERTPERLAVVGPFLSGHAALARGANVQLAGSVDGASCRALVWERGVGPTSASGTSACAVATAMVSTGRMPPGAVRVGMPGGALDVFVGDALELRLRGPVREVCEGVLRPGVVDV